MGKRGPAKIPTNILRLENSKLGEDQAKIEVQPPDLVADCPDWLPPEGKAEWDRVGPQLESVRLLSSFDRAIFASYCLAWAHIREAQQHLAEDGATVEGSQGQTVASPWEQILNRAQVRLFKCGSAMGLSPSARAGLSVEKTDGDKLEQWQAAKAEARRASQHKKAD